ncbi:hypothetical protein C8R45DRAFT_1109493 [Mycena sanguinolenta]|nr:hypothetical protein C8R45DRAFT_1109493 [Mycena sanguinolenta]
MVLVLGTWFNFVCAATPAIIIVVLKHDDTSQHSLSTVRPPAGCLCPGVFLVVLCAFTLLLRILTHPALAHRVLFFGSQSSFPIPLRQPSTLAFAYLQRRRPDPFAKGALRTLYRSCEVRLSLRRTGRGRRIVGSSSSVVGSSSSNGHEEDRRLGRLPRCRVLHVHLAPLLRDRDRNRTLRTIAHLHSASAPVQSNLIFSSSSPRSRRKRCDEVDPRTYRAHLPHLLTSPAWRCERTEGPPELAVPAQLGAGGGKGGDDVQPTASRSKLFASRSMFRLAPVPGCLAQTLLHHSLAR